MWLKYKTEYISDDSVMNAYDHRCLETELITFEQAIIQRLSYTAELLKEAKIVYAHVNTRLSSELNKQYQELFILDDLDTVRMKLEIWFGNLEELKCDAYEYIDSLTRIVFVQLKDPHPNLQEINDTILGFLHSDKPECYSGYLDGKVFGTESDIELLHPKLKQLLG